LRTLVADRDEVLIRIDAPHVGGYQRDPLGRRRGFIAYLPKIHVSAVARHHIIDVALDGSHGRAVLPLRRESWLHAEEIQVPTHAVRAQPGHELIAPNALFLK